MKILLDSSVLIECFTSTGKFFANTRKLLLLAVSKECTLWLSVLQVSDIYYLLSKGNHPDFAQSAKKKLQILMRSVHLCSIGGIEIDAALESSEESLDVALLCRLARKLKVDCIITNDIAAFKDPSTQVFTPDSFFAWTESEYGTKYSEIAL